MAQTKVITAQRKVPGTDMPELIPNAPFGVYVNDGLYTTLATGPGLEGNPFTTDDNGQVVITAPNGTYDLQVTNGDGTVVRYPNQVWSDIAALSAAAVAASDNVTLLAAQVQANTTLSQDYVATAMAQAMVATSQADLAQSYFQSALTGNQFYGAAADALANGVTALSIGAAGSGGTDGTYAVTFTGGGGTGATGQIVVAGGKIVSATRLTRGKNFTSAPTVSFTVPGLTGSPSVIASIGVNAGPNIFFAVSPSSNTNAAYDLYQVNSAGTASSKLSEIPGTLAVINGDRLLQVKLGSNLSDITPLTINGNLSVNAATLTATRAGGPLTATPNSITQLTALSAVMSATAGAAEVHFVSPDASGLATTDYVLPFSSPGGAVTFTAAQLANVPLLRPLTRLVFKSKAAGVGVLRGSAGSVPGGGTYIITASTSNAIGDHPTVENPAGVGDFDVAVSFTVMMAAENVETRLDTLEAATILAPTGPSPVPGDEVYFKRGSTFFRSPFSKLMESMYYASAGITIDGRYESFTSDTLLSNLDPEYGLKMVKPQTSSWTDNITMIAADKMGVESSTVTAAYVEAADQASADYFVTARFLMLSETSGGRPAVLLGASGTAGDFICYEFAYTPTGSVLLFRRASAASTTTLGSVPAAFVPYAAIGESVSLSMSRTINSAGNVVLNCYVNGALALTYTDSDAAKITRAGRGGIKMASQSSKLQTFAAGARSAFIGDLTIDSPQKDRCLRRDEGLNTRTFTVSGSAVLGAGAVMARIINDRTKAEVVAPFTLDGAPSSTYTGSVVNLPVGWYRVQVWQVDRPRVRRSVRFAIARKVIALLGQSNMENLFGAPSITGLELRSPVRVLKGDGNGWYPLIVGPGIAREAKILTTSWPDEPYGFLCYAITGTTAESWMVGGSSWNAFINTSTGAGQPACQFEFDEVHWDQSEANSMTAEATHLANTRSIFSQLRSVSGRPNLPIFVASTGRNTLGSNYDTVRKVQQTLAQDANNYYGPSRIDIPLDISGVHHPFTGYQTVGSRHAQASLKLDAKVAFGARGPIVTGASAVLGSTKITIACSLDGGTALTDAAGNAAGTGLTGFNVYYGGALQLISGTAITGSTNIELTVPSVPATGVTVFWAEGGNPDVSNYPKDNSSLGLPLRPIGQAINVVVS